MAVGLPDYYRGIRPRYGAAQLLRADKDAVANDTVLLGGVTGKGMIYGGHVETVHTSTQQDCKVELHVDGKDIGSKNLDNLVLFALDTEHSYATYLLKYDEVGYRYVVGILPGITFEKSFEIYYTESHGGTPRIRTRILYALI